LPQVTQDIAYQGRPAEPGIWHRPGWLRAPLLALAWAVLVVYGSLLPFGFDFTGLTEHAGGVWSVMAKILTSPAWVAPTTDASSLGVPVWASDLGLNLALYAPLGVLFRLTASRLTGRQWLQVISAGAAIVSMSWAIESAQSLIPGRYASLQDILSNTAGGLMGVLLGHLVNRAWRGGAFVAYRLTARPRRWLNRCLQASRGRVLWVSVILLLDVGLIALGYMAMGPVVSGEAGSQGLSLVPFERYFQRSYDVGVLLMGRTAVVYGLAGALLMLPVIRRRTRRALVWAALSVCLMSVAVEGLKPMTVGAAADVTGPLIALISGGLVLTMGFMGVHACRRSCRRQSMLPVRVERRGQAHDYRFGLRPDKAGDVGV